MTQPAVTSGGPEYADRVAQVIAAAFHGISPPCPRVDMADRQHSPRNHRAAFQEILHQQDGARGGVGRGRGFCCGCVVVGASGLLKCISMLMRWIIS
ncbi:hypothetical protein BDW62DRAFT_192211 [Aspergillus aurantiobrunneus]